MAPRALIIAVEDYPKVQGGEIARKLPGTLQAGLDFKAWLEEKWKAEGTDREAQLIFCSEPVQPGGRGATAQDINKALLDLAREGQNATEQLYVFFSGHGFSFVVGAANRADIVIGSDFVEAALSGSACLNLDRSIDWLRAHLGPGHHYFFIDACRTALTEADIQSPAGTPPWKPQTSGEAASFLLQSTVDGDVAEVSKHFPAALLAGLRGKGKAKVWDPQFPDSMLVRFESLRHYVKTTVPSGKVDGRTDGDPSEAVLNIIRPVPKSRVTLAIDGASPQDAGEALVKHWRSATPDRRPWTGPSTSVDLDPDDYSVTIRLDGGATAECDLSMPLDLYDDRTLTFRKVAATEVGLESLPAGDAAMEMPAAALDVVVPAGTEIMLRGLESGDEVSFTASATARLRPERYLATLQGTDGSVLKRQQIDATSGAPLVVKPADWRGSLSHEGIAARLPQWNGGVDFSESLHGPVTDPDLNLWLALLGGGRVVGSVGDYSKIGPFPLHDFASEAPGASPLYVLAGFETAEVRLSVGMHRDNQVSWSMAQAPPTLAGLREHYLPADAGPKLISFRIDGGVPYTLASFTSPNRATLITITRDADGQPYFAQYLLPIGHLTSHLRERWQVESRNALQDIRLQAQVHRAFHKRRDVAKEVPGGWLQDVLWTKWIDPIVCCLAAYELLRRGQRDQVRTAIENLSQFFGDLPDTSALALLADQPGPPPNGAPLFLDGVRALPEATLPLPASHLDFTGTWTMWRAVVKD